MKKRILSMAVCVMMLLSCSAACADSIDLSGMSLDEMVTLRDELSRAIAQQIVWQNAALQPKAGFNEEILFRGMAWGTSAADVRAQLADQGVMSSEQRIESDTYIYAWNVSDDVTIEANAGAAISVYDFPDGFTVAGYPLSAMHVYCPYSYTSDSVDRSVENTKLMYAEMKFDVADYDLVFEDLSNKLSSLYGQMEEVTDNNGYTSLSDGTEWTEYNTWRVWYGENNTGVYLYRTCRRDKGTDTVKNPEMILVYGRTDGAAYLAGLMSAMTNEAKAQDALLHQQNANNTDGL